MYNIFLIIILFSFSIADTYSWEDGGTILGTYGGTVSSSENVSSTDEIDPYEGDYMLKVTTGADEDTEQVFIGWVTNLSSGDEITACFYGYDDTPAAKPSFRIWGSWSANNDINAYAGSASGNEDYTAGTGWDQVCHTWSTLTSGNWDEGEALVIQARMYSDEAVDYFIDLISVETTSNTATINFPEPVEGLIADAGSDQTVDAASVVTLDGSGSINTNGDVAAYLWEQTAGIAVSLDDDEAMTTTFTAPNESTTLQFDLSVYDIDGNEESDSVTITVLASAGDLPISDIQGEQNASPYEGQIVSSTGIVTADAEYGFFIQDASGPWNGIWIFDFGDNSINRGDRVEVSGMVEEYNGLTEINITDGSLSIISPNNDLFNSVTVDMLDESHESVLVTVSGTCNSEPDPQYGEWQLGNHTIQNEIYDFDPVLGEEYTITGPVDCYNSQYKVLPRDANDVQEGLSNSEFIQDFSILNAYPNPFNPTLTIEFSTLSTELIEVSVYDLMGQKIDVLYTGLSQASILNNITWDASNYSSGDYFIYLKTDNFTKTHKITLIK